MSPEDLDKTLAFIAARAKDLRESGVVGRVTVGEVSFELDAPSAPQPEQDEPKNPLDDADTYGGYIPTRRRPQEFDEE